MQLTSNYTDVQLTPAYPLHHGLNRKSTDQSWPMTIDEEADAHHKRREEAHTEQKSVVFCFFLKYLPVQLNLRRLSLPTLYPQYGDVLLG